MGKNNHPLFSHAGRTEPASTYHSQPSTLRTHKVPLKCCHDDGNDSSDDSENDEDDDGDEEPADGEDIGSEDSYSDMSQE